MTTMNTFVNEEIIQGIEGFNIPPKFIAEDTILVAGSPHGHGSKGVWQSKEDSAVFKQNMFYSLAWYSTPAHTIVMTYAALSTDRLGFYGEPKFVRQGRVLVHTKAFFAGIGLLSASKMT